MAKLLLPKQLYQSLFDAFFAAASVNCNAFLEFCCQNNEIRAKWSDTNKPYSAADANKPISNTSTPVPDVSKPPPSFAPIVINGKRKNADQPRVKKRRHAVISPSSPLKLLDNDAAPETNEHDANHDEVSSDIGGQSAPDPPEIVREQDQICINAEKTIISDISLDNTSDCDELEYTHYSCDFETPNRFSVLGDVIEDEISVTSDDRFKSAVPSSAIKSVASNYNKVSCQPCERSHKCFNCSDSCQDDCEFAICPGPMTMKCYVCKKKFTNQDFIKLYNDKNYGFESYLYGTGPNWTPPN